MSMKKLAFKFAVTSIALVGLQTSSYAVDSTSVEVAGGDKVQMLRLGAQWDWKDTAWFKSNGTQLSGYWDLSLAEWHQQRYNNTDSSKNFTDIGFTPVFRFQRDDKKASMLRAALACICFLRCTTTMARNWLQRFNSVTTLAPVTSSPMAWTLA